MNPGLRHWGAEVQAEGDELEADVRHRREQYIAALDRVGPKHARGALDDLALAMLRRDALAKVCGASIEPSPEPARAAADDPAHAALQRALTDAHERAEAAANGIIRCVTGGVSWADARVRRYRGDLERARTDLDVALEALRVLDEMDAEIGGAR